MDALHVASHYHVTELSSGGGRGGSGAVGPLFIVLAIIMVLGVVAGFIGRVCGGRHWGGDTQHDFEGWVEKRCASCIDGDIEAPPPPPPPPPEKPPDPANPPPEVPPPPPADAPPAAAPADAPPPAADPAPPPAPAPADPPADAEAPKAETPAEEAAPPPSEPLPPPPPPPPPPEEAGPAAPPARMEPLTYTMLYPSYSCNCHICAREGIFE